MLLDTPVQLGVQLRPEQATWQGLREAALRVEELGADILFNWDHFFPLYGDPDGTHFEAWTVLSAWAEATGSIRLGTLVNCNSYRNPDLQADMARTIDHISGGRFVFGTGAGWFQRDYDEYGYEFGTPGARIDALAEGLERIRARWARLNPPPVHEIPIMIGGKGERKTLRLVARHADIWHSFVRPNEIAHKFDVIRRWGDAEQRDVSGILVSNELHHRTTARADALYDAGVRLFTLGLQGPDFDFELVRHWLDWRDAKNA